jgi:hypothetical protein
MHHSPETITVNEAFFHPIEGLAAASPNARPCPELTDDSWIRLGIHRVLERVESGRGFLQEHGPRFDKMPRHANYFLSLQSARRCAVAHDVNLELCRAVEDQLPDRLAHIPELKGYVCLAMDGHWHGAATHDARVDDRRVSVGHFFSLNLHNHSLSYLDCAEGLHEHDMHALQRIKPKGLRQNIAKGRRVLIIYDRAGIDFAFWKRCRQECAVYFVSRVKEGMVLEDLMEGPWDPNDKRNRGVQSDRLVLSRDGLKLRVVEYVAPENGKWYAFLTNETDLQPGIIAELYRRRWEVEKVFDEIKTKLGEKQAWASGEVARRSQGRFVAMTHNLLVLYEHRLSTHRQVQPEAEKNRSKKRIGKLVAIARHAGREVSALLLATRNATQRSVKFLRWLRQSLRDHVTEAAAAQRLASLHAHL